AASLRYSRLKTCATQALNTYGVLPLSIMKPKTRGRKRTAVTKSAKVASPDEYLANVRNDQRAALERLRRTIKSAAPGAEECISYGLPAFRLNGRALVAFSAAATHCSFFPMSGTTVQSHQKELRGYETTKGTIRFDPKRPLPAALV